MPPKKKSQPKNAFFYFMLDMKSKLEAKGRRFPGGLKDVADACGPLWTNLPPEQRAVFDQKAKAAKGETKDSMECKYDSLGIPIAHRINYALSLVEQKASMYRAIQNQISQLEQLHMLVDHYFYIGHFNYICVTDDKDYIPGEIAIIRFSLRDGVQAVYQEFIDPGPLPLGYTFTAMELSKSTHKIPIKNFSFANSDYAEVMNHVEEFVSNDSSSIYFEPVYFIREDLDGARKSFDWLCAKAGLEEGKMECFELNKLFCELRRHSSEDGCNAFPSEEYAGEKLKQETFDYSPGMACENTYGVFDWLLRSKFFLLGVASAQRFTVLRLLRWHESNDEPKYCSRAYAKRFCYLITDYCCALYGLPMRPESHCPKSFIDVGNDDDPWAEDSKTVAKAPGKAAKPVQDIWEPVPLNDHGSWNPVPWGAPVQPKIEPDPMSPPVRNSQIQGPPTGNPWKLVPWGNSSAPSNGTRSVNLPGSSRNEDFPTLEIPPDNRPPRTIPTHVANSQNSTGGALPRLQDPRANRPHPGHPMNNNNVRPMERLEDPRRAPRTAPTRQDYPNGDEMEDFPSLGRGRQVLGQPDVPETSASKPAFRAPHSRPQSSMSTDAQPPRSVGIGRGAGVGLGRGRY